MDLYSHKTNYHVESKKDYATHPSIPSEKSLSDARSITIKVKSEALTSVNNLEHNHNTRRKKQKSEKRLTINPPSLNLPNYTRG